MFLSLIGAHAYMHVLALENARNLKLQKIIVCFICFFSSFFSSSLLFLSLYFVVVVVSFRVSSLLCGLS